MRLAQSAAALRDRRFAWYFAARSVSWVGSTMVSVALAFAVLHIEQSASALAWVLGARTLATVLFVLVGGVVADRFSRIAVLQVSHGLTMLSQGAAAALLLSGQATIPAFVAIEAVNGPSRRSRCRR